MFYIRLNSIQLNSTEFGSIHFDCKTMTTIIHPLADSSMTIENRSNCSSQHLNECGQCLSYGISKRYLPYKDSRRTIDTIDYVYTMKHFQLKAFSKQIRSLVFRHSLFLLLPSFDNNYFDWQISSLVKLKRISITNYDNSFDRFNSI